MIPEGYKMKTTFFSDFNIADKFGEEGVKDTYRRAYDNWKDDLIYMEELTFVLNIKCWEHYNSGDSKLSSLYASLYDDCYNKCLDNLPKEDRREYLDFLD